MAHKKAGGSSKNLRDSQPKYLGIKVHDGEKAQEGSILVRQRGTKIMAGSNVRMGRDHTLYAVGSGIVKYKNRRKKHFDGSTKTLKQVDVVAA